MSANDEAELLRAIRDEPREVALMALTELANLKEQREALVAALENVTDRLAQFAETDEFRAGDAQAITQAAAALALAKGSQ